MLVWGLCGQVFFSNLESIHVRAAKIIFNLDSCTPVKVNICFVRINLYERRSSGHCRVTLRCK